MKAKNIKEGTSGYSRSLPYQNYKSLFTLVEGDDEITGGRADNLSTKDLAKKHGVKPKVIKDQLKKGQKVEMEHTNKPKLSKEIASDHVEEIPDYYDRLEDMESRALKVNESKKKPLNELNKVALSKDPRFQQYFQVIFSELIKRGLTGDQIGEVFDDRENKNTLFVMYSQDFYPTKWLDDLDYSMIATDIAQPFHESESIFKSKSNIEAVLIAIEKELKSNQGTFDPIIPSRELRVLKNILINDGELDKHHQKYYNKLLKLYKNQLAESSSVAVGYYSGGVISPRSQKNDAKREKMEKFKDATEPEGEHGEVEEEMVHPDDKIGNMMLKKMDVPQPFTSNKKGEVHQKKVSESSENDLPKMNFLEGI